MGKFHPSCTKEIYVVYLFFKLKKKKKTIFLLNEVSSCVSKKVWFDDLAKKPREQKIITIAFNFDMKQEGID